MINKRWVHLTNALAILQVYHNYVTIMYLNGVILHTCQTEQTELHNGNFWKGVGKEIQVST